MLLYLSCELVVLRPGSRLAGKHPSPDVVSFQAFQQHAHLIAGRTLVQRLVECLDAWYKQNS